MIKKQQKKLSEMTLEELWRLFPITLKKHDGLWSLYYEDMENQLQKSLKNNRIISINHIGSTAIQGISAKPIIDILIETDTPKSIKDIAKILEKYGFTVMNETKDRISLNFGYTENGFAEKVYHVHLRLINDNDELYFRDYMNEFPECAKQYEKLKKALSKKYKYNRDAYTAAKSELIAEFTAKAKKCYQGRYTV